MGYIAFFIYIQLRLGVEVSEPGAATCGLVAAACGKMFMHVFGVEIAIIIAMIVKKSGMLMCIACGLAAFRAFMIGAVCADLKKICFGSENGYTPWFSYSAPIIYLIVGIIGVTRRKRM